MNAAEARRLSERSKKKKEGGLLQRTIDGVDFQIERCAEKGLRKCFIKVIKEPWLINNAIEELKRSLEERGFVLSVRGWLGNKEIEVKW